MADYPFSRLDPDTVLACVEQALGRRLLNVCRPHAIYINRVFELQDEDGVFIIAKFYRPHRWSEAALQDELGFLLDCAAHEMPVIAPLPLAGGGYLGSCGDIRFAVYPRCGGRLVDEYQDEHWLQIGRLLGRLHQVGRSGTASAREWLHPRYSTRKQADYLLEHRLLPDDLVSPFRRIVDALIEETAEMTIPGIFKEHGETVFRKWEHDILMELCQREKLVVSTGGGAPCHGDMMEIMNHYGTTVYIKLEPEALKERLMHARTERPLIRGMKGNELLKFVRSKLEEREAYYSQAKFTTDGLNLHLDTLVNILQNNS